MTPEQDQLPMQIVAFGASAGGVEALSGVLRSLPADTGMAFIVVQHLDPTHPSLLGQILARDTEMPVLTAADGEAVKGDHIYVTPENVTLAIDQGRLRLKPRPQGHGALAAIDAFFESLAHDFGSNAIGVLLSGTGSDGSQGLRAIRAEGGVTIVQEPTTARFAAMPQAAIEANVVDLVLSPEDIGPTLARLRRQHGPLAVAQDSQESTPTADAEDFAQVLTLLRRSLGVDFAAYKSNTIRRRIARRQAVHGLTSLAEYFRFMQTHQAEVQHLFNDLLIHVSSFFRDSEAFEALQSQVLPQIIASHGENDPVRIWVPGCATGEEAYSIAICLIEALQQAGRDCPIRIFATDISDAAVAAARRGVFPLSIGRDVSESRLERFFDRTPYGYSVTKSLRESCLFVHHDLTSDPPFLKLDLISCRNLLIYFGPALQKQVIPMFYHALNPHGFLFIGRSEGLAGFGDLFSPVDKVNKLFSRSTSSQRTRLEFPFGRYRVQQPQATAIAPTLPGAEDREIGQLMERTLLNRYTPVGVVVDDQLEIRQVHGDTSPYLTLAAGSAVLSLPRMIRPALLPDLLSAIQQARVQVVRVTKEGLTLQERGVSRQVTVEVVPLKVVPEPSQRLFMVVFREQPARRDALDEAPEPPADDGGTAEAYILQLQQELEAIKDQHRALIEQYESANEELLAANEEAASHTEELQSSYEELETAKEELESANEELGTVNEELQISNRELHTINSDLVNLVEGVDLAIVIVDMRRRIRRFTPKARDLLRLRAGDEGRAIGDFKPDFDAPDLDALIATFLSDRLPQELEVQGRDDTWYRLQILPYLNQIGEVEGALLILVDITALKTSVLEANQARDFATAIIDTVPTATIVLDPEFHVRQVNQAFLETFQVTSADTLGRTIFELGDGAWDIPRLREMLAAVLPQRRQVRDFEVEHDFPAIGHKIMMLSARQVESVSEIQERIIIAITEAPAQLKLYASEEAGRAKDLFLATLSHELRTPLHAILGYVHLLKIGHLDAPGVKRALDTIERSTQIQAQIINDLLDISRIAAGKMHLQIQPVAIGPVVAAAVESVRLEAVAKDLTITTSGVTANDWVAGDALRLEQVLWNLLVNAVKFTPAGGRVAVQVDRDEKQLRIAVSDTGKGLSDELLRRLFERFVQGEDLLTRHRGGLGLGLALAQQLMGLLGGRITAESEGEGKGARFTVMLPLLPAAPVPTPSATESGEPDDRPDKALADRRILIVEDDAGSREMLLDVLRMHGAQPVAVASAREALARLDHAMPDLILSDIALPEESGYSFIQALRQRPPDQGGRLPAIALTAFAGEVARREAWEAGFQGFLEKPIDIPRLIQQIAAAIRAAGPEPGVAEGT